MSPSEIKAAVVVVCKIATDKYRYNRLNDKIFNSPLQKLSTAMLMKYLISLLILLAFSSCMFGLTNSKHKENSVVEIAQDEEDEYPSSEMDRYYKMRKFHISGLPSREDALAFNSPYCEISEIENYSPYVDSIIWRTPYNDSIWKIQRETEDYYSWPRDELAGVYKGSIIKHEKKGSLEAFIYTNGKYTNIYFADPDIWIALSKDNGVTWKHYFTGLYERQPLYPKWYSRLPLIADENNLQIEAALVYQTEQHTHPGPFPEYALAKDGIIITFDMNVIARDSDGDGLTDIVEAKFSTNPYNKDTDGDGIPDNLDLNPRQKGKRKDKTIIFETIIDREFEPVDFAELERIMDLPDSLREMENLDGWKWSDIPPYKPGAYLANDSTTRTVFIVTDDPALKAIQSKYVRVIIISSKEYMKSHENAKFKMELDKFSFSPMFKVDGRKNIYKIDCWHGTGGDDYVVQKTKNGWRIRIISSYIS